MSEKQEELKLQVTDNSEEVNVEVKWEHLTELYKQTGSFIQAAANSLTEIGNTFKPIIDADEEAGTLFKGTAKVLNDFSTELVNIAKGHCKQNEVEGGKVELVPYVGLVDRTNQDQISLYMTVVFAYNGLTDKIKNVADNTLTTLLATIQEAGHKHGMVVSEEEFKKLEQQEVKSEQEDTKEQ